MANRSSWLLRDAARRARSTQASQRSETISAPPVGGHRGPTLKASAPIVTSSVIADAVAAERTRCRTIVQAAEAKGRERSAASIAFQSNIDASTAKRMLAEMRLDADVEAAETDAAVKQILTFQRNAERGR